MLKKASSRGTRCIRQSNGSPVRLASSLAAALLEGLFEHPAWHSDAVRAFDLLGLPGVGIRFFNTLLGDHQLRSVIVSIAGPPILGPVKQYHRIPVRVGHAQLEGVVGGGHGLEAHQHSLGEVTAQGRGRLQCPMTSSCAEWLSSADESAAGRPVLVLGECGFRGPRLEQVSRS